MAFLLLPREWPLAKFIRYLAMRSGGGQVLFRRKPLLLGPSTSAMGTSTRTNQAFISGPVESIG